MADGNQSEDRIRPYRILIHNLPINDETVEEIFGEEIEGASLVEWEIEKIFEYDAPVTCSAGYTMFPHRDALIKLTYREK